MKKGIVILLLLSMLLTFTACGSNSAPETNESPAETEVKKEQKEEHSSDSKNGEELDVYSDGGEVYYRELLMLPDGDVMLSQTVDAGENIYLYGKINRTEEVLYKMDKEGLEFEKIQLPEECSIFRFTPAVGNELCGLCGSEENEYSVQLLDAEGNWSELQLPMLDEYEENGLLWIYPTENGYVAMTAYRILALDKAGNKIKEIGTYSGMADCFSLSDGRIIVVGGVADKPGGETITRTMVLDKDFNTLESYDSERVFGYYNFVSEDGSRILCGNMDTVFSFDYKNDSIEPLINSTLSGMNASTLIDMGDGVYFSLKDGAPYLWRRNDGSSATVLTLAAYNLDMSLSKYIELYNEKSTDYKIKVVDYAAFDNVGADGQGLNRLRTDIISGKTPDIFDLSNLPAQLYAAHGIFEDLKPYLNADAPVQYDSLIPSAVKALEYKDGLYYITPQFQIITVCGNESFAGSGDTWTVDDFFAAVDGMNPVNVFGPETTKNVFLSYVLTFLGKEYMDVNTGKCNFTDESFVRFLEFAAAIPDDGASVSDGSQPSGRAYAGKQALLLNSLGNGAIGFMSFDDAIFGGQARYVGFPTNSSNGIAMEPDALVAMSVSSQHKDGVMDFIYFLLGDGRQKAGNTMPINKNILPERMDSWEKTYNEYPKVLHTLCDGASIEIEGEIDPEIAKNRINELIDRIDCSTLYDEAVMDIVIKECQPYFAGQMSSEQAAANIQSKVQIYLSEQYG